ncbi:MAG: hemolysin family protein [Longimicrobiales bacterium]
MGEEHALEALSVGSVLIRLGVALLLVAANGFFVAAEFALVGARRTRIEALARAGNRGAKLAESAIHRLDHYISGTQLGITLASLGLGWVGESTIAAMLIALFQGLPAPVDVIATHTVAVIVAFALITFLHIVLGELAPKSLALLFPERVAMWTAGPLIVFSRVLTPFIAFLNGAANLILHLVGLRAPTEMERVHRPEEIEMLLTQSYEHGLLREEPVEMIRGVFHLSETQAAEVMTPRTQVIALDVETPLEAAADFILENGHSRYPVYEETIDHVIGVALARDVWQALRNGAQELRGVVREALFVPDTKSIEHLLREMQKGGIHMAVVIDEFGGTAGVVTIEDLLEEVVGEIADETDEAPVGFEHAPDGDVHFRGAVPITELNELYDTRLPDEDYTTVGGFVLGRLGRLPRVGDEVVIRGGRLRVLHVKGRRIERLALTLTSGTAPRGSDRTAHADDEIERGSLE